MRKSIFLLAIAISLFGFKLNTNNRKYILIRMVSKSIPNFTKKVKVSEINKEDVNKLNEPLRALAAYYSALAGNNCDGTNCGLTSALGLGVQGSNNHIDLIKKWLPNDTIARTLVRQNCFQSSNGSSYFTNYKSLIFDINKDTVIVKFVILKFDHGKTSLQGETDTAIVHNNETIRISR
jgi:hypothetical protein